jgi:hypothetical protein
MIVIENEFVTLEYLPKEKIVRHKYHKYLYGHIFRSALDRGVDLLIEHQAHKWLSDNRAVKAHAQDDFEWVNSVWLPRAISAGWTSWALIQPHDVIAQMNMRRFQKSFSDQGVTARIFPSPEEGLAWLISQP